MTYRRIFALFVLVIMVAISALAQLQRVTINGRPYDAYIVKQGETVYSISQSLGISRQQIIDYNPAVADGLKAGMRLYFPTGLAKGKVTTSTGKAVAQQTSSSTTSAPKSQGVHTVKKGESVYGISKQYHITVDQLLNANPAAREGIKAGQVLEIPSQKVEHHATTKRDDTNFYVVKDGDTFFSIAKKLGFTMAELQALNPDVDPNNIENGMFLRLRAGAPHVDNNAKKPATQNKATNIIENALPQNKIPGMARADTIMPSTKQDRDLNIVVMLPFMLDQAKPAKQAQMYTDFYRGLLLAAKANNGPGQRPVKIIALDTENSNATVKRLLKSDTIRQATVVIAPETDEQLAAIAAAGQKNNFYTFNIFNVKDESYATRPSMVQANISHDLMYEKAINALKQRTQGRTLVILDNENGRRDKAEFVGEVKKAYKQAGLPYTTLKYAGTLKVAELDSLVATGQRLMFLPVSGTSQEFGKFQSALQKVREQAADPSQYMVFGYPDWSAFRGDRLNELYDLNATIFTRFYDDQLSTMTQSVEADFEKWYGQKMMDVVPKQGLLGYDVGTYLIMALRTNVGDFGQQARAHNGLQSAFRFVHENDSKGLVNESLYIVDFMPEKFVKRTEL